MKVRKHDGPLVLAKDESYLHVGDAGRDRFSAEPQAICACVSETCSYDVVNYPLNTDTFEQIDALGPSVLEFLLGRPHLHQFSRWSRGGTRSPDRPKPGESDRTCAIIGTIAHTCERSWC